MFTDPEIVTSNDLRTRAYVKVYVDGVRYRFYNGKFLNIICNPNHTKTIKDRNKALASLQYNLKKKLEDGWRPDRVVEEKTKKVSPPAKQSITGLLAVIEAEDLSNLYKRDMRLLVKELLGYLKKKDLSLAPMDRIGEDTIEDFLKRYKGSATTYMNKRRNLSALFSRLVKKDIAINPVAGTKTMKTKATLHKAYTKDQLREVLGILELEHQNLYMCAVFMYGCFLRPHQEIRHLFRHHLNEDCSAISLSGSENKSRRNRTVYVPPYVRAAIKKYHLSDLHYDANLFTGNCDVFNESYFNTAWSRVKEDMVKDNIIDEEHTLYSFRHTAAVNLYMKTKDLYKVQQAMGHSSMTVTLTYMRSLGLVNNIAPDDVPDL